jgi:hypothetical protein
MVEHLQTTVPPDSEARYRKHPRRRPLTLWLLTLLACLIASPINESRADKISGSKTLRSRAKKGGSKALQVRSPNGIPTLTSLGSGLVADTSGIHGNQPIQAANPAYVPRPEMAVTPLPPGSSEALLSPPPFQLPNGPVTTTITSPTTPKVAPLQTKPPAAKSASLQQAGKPLLDRIRFEIKQRLYVFQNCALNARRRGVDCRRVDATWNIGADGTIKSIVFSNVPDPLFAVCLQRIENQPLVVKPGMELKIPTPIVFVR